MQIITNIALSEQETQYYVKYAVNETGLTGDEIDVIKITADYDDVDIEVKAKNAEKFERIRRITGYLVGTTDRWNDAKQAELRDRVKHA